MTTDNRAALAAPEWGACGFDEWHEPHEYVIADGDLPVTLPCPGIPGVVAAAYLRAHASAPATKAGRLPEPEGPGWDDEIRMTKRTLHDLLNRHVEAQRAAIEAKARALPPDPDLLARALHLASECKTWPAHGPHSEHEELAFAALANWPK